MQVQLKLKEDFRKKQAHLKIIITKVAKIQTTETKNHLTLFQCRDKSIALLTGQLKHQKGKAYDFIILISNFVRCWHENLLERRFVLQMAILLKELCIWKNEFLYFNVICRNISKCVK